MFQDDRMISFLSAIVIMVAIGTLVQRVDGVSGIFEPSGPSYVLREDRLIVEAGQLHLIDVFKNDTGTSSADRETLRVIKDPGCGQVFVQGNVLQYLAPNTCIGQQVIHYALADTPEGEVGVITAFVQGDPPKKRVAEQAKPIVVAESDDDFGPKLLTEDMQIGADAPSVIDTLAGGGATQANAAQADRAVAPVPMPRREPAAERTSDAEASDVPSDARDATVRDVPEKPKSPQPGLVTADVPDLKSTDLAALQGQPETSDTVTDPTKTSEAAPKIDAPSDAERSIVASVALARTVPPSNNATAVAPDAASPRRPRETSVLAGKDPAPNLLYSPASVSSRLGGAAPKVDRVDAVPPYAERKLRIAAFSGTADVVPKVRVLDDLTLDGPPRNRAPKGPRMRMLLDRVAPAMSARQQTDPKPGQAISASSLLGAADPQAEALSDLPVDSSQGPPEEPVLSAALSETVPSGAAAADKTTLNDSGEIQVGPAEEAQNGGKPAGRVAAIQRDRDCVVPASTTIDIGRAAQSTVSVTAPCHASTVAVLSYSGLNIAVPLDRDGHGAMTVLGFEPTTPALLTFVDGEKIDFDLPFKGANRVSRVALVWDDPIEMQLNAFEFGAKPRSAGHISVDNPKSFSAVRRKGGGFLVAYRRLQDAGSNVQIYSFWHRRRGPIGVVKLAADFASRNRDAQEGTCGTGALAAPTFRVIKSVDGRLERPIVRQVAPLDCSKVSLKTESNRLILDAVSDLLISN